MKQAIVIGNIGANAEVKSADGREFVTFRVADNDTYTDASGTKHTTTNWIDCVMGCDNGRPAVLPYLLAGTLVCVQGKMTTRVYSSQKDRCMKAGLKIHVSKVDLLGASGDIIPKRLYTEDGVQVDVMKYYHVPSKLCTLLDMKGRRYTVDENGWVTPEQEPQETGNTNQTTGDDQELPF